MECSKGFVSVIIVYAVSLMYLFQTNTKFWGYIMLIIAYLFSYGYIYQFSEPLTKGAKIFTDYVHGGVEDLTVNASYGVTRFITNTFTQGALYTIFMFFVLCIVFFSFYSLIKILNAYSFKSKKTGSFDLKLNKRRAKELDLFNWSFIIGNVALYIFIYYLIVAGRDGVKFEPFKGFLFLVAFVSVWIETGAATEFSYIKRD